MCFCQPFNFSCNIQRILLLVSLPKNKYNINLWLELAKIHLIA